MARTFHYGLTITLLVQQIFSEQPLHICICLCDVRPASQNAHVEGICIHS